MKKNIKKTTLISSAVLVFLMYSGLLSQSHGSALLLVDSAIANVGTTFKENTDTISHVFIIKNTGKKVLKIKQIKPGCGCATIKYDSIIPPGKKGKIYEVIKLDSLFVGIFSKSINVVSNAANAKVLKLILKGNLISVVTPSHDFLQLTAGKDKMVNKQMTFTTDKNDLKIVDLFFEQSSEKSIDWLNYQPISIQYKQLFPDSMTNDHYFTFILNFTFEYMLTNKTSGYFIIKTNHLKKERVKIGGVIEPFKGD